MDERASRGYEFLLLALDAFESASNRGMRLVPVTNTQKTFWFPDSTIRLSDGPGQPARV